MLRLLVCLSLLRVGAPYQHPCSKSLLGHAGRADRWSGVSPRSRPPSSNEWDAAAWRRAAAAALAAQLFANPLVPSAAGELGSGWCPLRPSAAMAAAPATADEAIDPTVEEVYNLVTKFALDQTYGGQDWPAAKAKFSAVAREKGSFEGAKQLAASLGDKYSRVIDPPSYAKMARFDLIGAGVLLAPDEAGEWRSCI